MSNKMPTALALAALSLAALFLSACDDPVDTLVPVQSVSLDQSTLSLVLKAPDPAATTPAEAVTSTLAATINPANASNTTVTWSTSDAKIATVADGVVSAVATGQATITATSADGQKTASCEVTVSGQAATSLSLDKTSASIAAHDSLTLVATYEPADTWDQTVTWSSSDETIATVADGTVSGVATGTATITATSADGLQSASCAITIDAAAPTLSEIVGNWKQDTVSATFYCTINADKTFLKRQFFNSDPSYCAFEFAGTMEIVPDRLAFTITKYRSTNSSSNPIESVAWINVNKKYFSPAFYYDGHIFQEPAYTFVTETAAGSLVGTWTSESRDDTDFFDSGKTIKYVYVFGSDLQYSAVGYKTSSGVYPNTPYSSASGSYSINSAGQLEMDSTTYGYLVSGRFMTLCPPDNIFALAWTRQ